MCIRDSNNTMVSVNNWKELVVIKDKKINIDVVRNSALVMVDAGAVTGKYMRFFARVKSNKNITCLLYTSSCLKH